ncbi:cyclic di-GMP phosphodiesterase response regulator RpfG [Peptococcaceae bacterium CEB3]|nr:cyclic di-GMP phosphodiesterase response regulator RpfG [Peptococcaceae bacterium CEB3]
MRLVNTRYVQEGAVLARPVVSAAGQVLLRAEVMLTSVYIERLKKLGFDVVFVKDDRLEDIEVHIALSNRTRKMAYQTVHSILKNVESGRESELGLDAVQKTVEEMIGDLLYSRDVITNLSEIRGYDDYTFHHSVNTTVMGLILGIAAGYSKNKLLELGMGILMHDVGKTKVPPGILNKQTPLTEEEFDEIKRHTVYGYEILRRNRDFNVVSAHVALEHQEKWDGSGYPRGLKGKEIQEFGRLAAVADVYEALTSRRIYRSALEPYQAYEYIIAHSGTHFEPAMLSIFAKHISVYPSGTGVKLNNGQRGNVIKQNPCFPGRPYVRIFYQGEEPLSVPIDYNLMEHPSLFIIGVDNR